MNKAVWLLCVETLKRMIATLLAEMGKDMFPVCAGIVMIFLMVAYVWKLKR